MVIRVIVRIVMLTRGGGGEGKENKVLSLLMEIRL